MNKIAQAESNRFIRVRYVWTFAVICLLAATLISLLAKWIWFADLVVNFRVQLSILGAGLAIVGLLLKRWKLLLLTGVLLFINVWPLIDYFGKPTADANPDGPVAIKIISFNVLSSNTRFGETIEWIKGQSPDVFAIHELSPKWASKLEVLKSSYPYQRVVARRGNFGMAVYSRLPVEEFEVLYLDEFNLPSIRATIEASENIEFTLMAVHPLPPLSRLRYQHRNKTLVDAASNFEPDVSRVMVGDFNMTPWSPWFSEIKKAGNLVDASRGQGMAPTWYVFPTFLGGLKIDHVLTSPDFNCTHHEVGPDLGSDHRPVIVELNFKASPSAE